MENEYILYRHTNLDNGKIYVGITKRKVKERWQNGFGYQDNKKFFKDIVKYGWDNFKHDILMEKLTKEQAYNYEIKYINKYNSVKCGYNNSPGGYLVSLDTCKKISNIRKNKKIGQVRKRKYRYFQYSLKGDFIEKYETLEDIKKVIPNIKQSGLNQCLNGKIKTYYNFKWFKEKIQ